MPPYGGSNDGREAPRGRDYRKRHLQSVQQMLRLVNEVLTMAPEYSDDAMVMLPLGAILDWTSAWSEFLRSAESRYVLNDSPGGWQSEAARQAIGIEQVVLATRAGDRSRLVAAFRQAARACLTGPPAQTPA